MYAALQYIGSLPDGTVTYVGHEYTAGCLAFAKTIEPEGEGTARLEKFVKEHSVTTGLSTIKDEKEWNPYMRLDTPAVRYANQFFDGPTFLVC
jgi:hydroxyacylglutathione hydrolase